MNPMKAGFLDTNILIGFFKGDEAVKAALERFETLKIPAIAYAEFMVGLPAQGQRSMADKAIDALFEIVQTDRATCYEAASLRRETRLKLPDALIYAAARVGGGVLITRNTKDFNPDWADVYVP
jgi:predicted nucleic acid-binding protein